MEHVCLIIKLSLCFNEIKFQERFPPLTPPQLALKNSRRWGSPRGYFREFQFFFNLSFSCSLLFYDSRG